MTTGRSVEVALAPNAGEIQIRRGRDVDDVTWLSFRAAVGTTRGSSASMLCIPIERFLARSAQIQHIAADNGVSVHITDPHARALLVNVREDRAELEVALGDPAASEDVDLRLGGSRFQRELRPFQVRDLGRLLALRHGANFSVPGAGKTTVTYATYEAERVAGRVSRLLVIAPLSAFSAWIEEATECFSAPPVIFRFDGSPIPRDAEILIVNYQRLANSFSALAEWVDEQPTMVVLDEAHRMKAGWAGQWGSSCLSLAFLAKRREILTGTPSPQSPRDFIALLDFLWPAQARRVLPDEALAADPPPDAVARASDAIRPLFVRTRKSDLELPPTNPRAEYVDLTGLQREIYTALRNQYAGNFVLGPSGQLDFVRMGQVVMYLLEAATDPQLLTAGSTTGDPEPFEHPPLEIPPDSDLADLLMRYGLYETPPKFRRLMRMVKENAEQGRKTLVWSNFVRNIERLRGQLAAYEPAVIHGAVPADGPDGAVTRETEIARFRHDPNCLVLLANPAAMSEGISLHHECHDAIYLDRTFNAGQLLQSVDRIHRLGLPPDAETRITFLITRETIDVVVDHRVKIKADRMGRMLDDPGLSAMALPNEEQYAAPVDDSEDDLEALFQHLRGADGS